LGLGLGLRAGGLRHPWLLLQCSSVGAKWLLREANYDEAMTLPGLRFVDCGGDSAARDAYLATAQ
jgi:hypothetical protein